MYKNIHGITPNRKEAESIFKKSIANNADAAEAIKRIRSRLGTQFAVITRGDPGISAGAKGRNTFHLPAFTHEVFDVTGAGDTVVSVLILAMVSGATLREAASIANIAASIVVEKIGASQVTIEEIIQKAKYLLKRN